MRDYSKVSGQFWTDHKSREWPLIRSSRRLKFKYPLHAALRAYVFQRDGFKCCRCHAEAIDVPTDYDGRVTLKTNTKVSSGFNDVLILDHVLTLKAGGLSHPENTQTLCETCNKKKIKEDNAAANAYRNGTV